MSAIVIWRPEALNARLLAAQVGARQDWAKAAALRSPSRRVAASIKVLGDRVAATHPLGSMFESGVKPHAIEPKKRALRLADGSFVSGGVQHPGMKAQPFLRPTLPLWAPLYRRRALAAFRGF